MGVFSYGKKRDQKVNKKGFPQALEESSKQQLFPGVKNSVEFDFYNSFFMILAFDAYSVCNFFLKGDHHFVNQT